MPSYSPQNLRRIGPLISARHAEIRAPGLGHLWTASEADRLPEAIADVALVRYLTVVLPRIAMAAPKPLTTRVSTKGQVILPKLVRDQRNWRPGTRLVVEETEEGVLLKPAPLFPQTTTGEMFGVLKRPGKALSLEQMDAAVAAEARRRARD